MAVTLIGKHVNAQDVNRTDFRDKFLFGIKIGGNVSNIYDTRAETFNTNPKTGFVTGMFLAVPIGKYIGVQPELLFAQRGFKAKGTILGNTFDITRTTDYIDVPLLFAFKPSEFFTIVMGPQFSYLIRRTDRFANASTSIEQETNFQNDSFLKNTMCLTGGFEFTLKHLVLGARAGFDVRNNNRDGSSSTIQYKNVWYQGTVGVRFYRTKN